MRTKTFRGIMWNRLFPLEPTGKKSSLKLQWLKNITGCELLSTNLEFAM